MNQNNDILYKINPKFNFLYELGMPTGKKIKRTLLILFIFIIGYIIFIFNKSSFNLNELKVFGNIDLQNILFILLNIALVATLIKLVFHIIFQTMQYKNISYTFYNDHMIYEDSFLNQHKKNINYSNVKEVEIRRTVWDRILGYGIIVIYTNAENEFSNGLVIYSIKQPSDHYNKIENIIHNNNGEQSITKSSKISSNGNKEEIVVDEDNGEENFLESLKHINTDQDTQK